MTFLNPTDAPDFTQPGVSGSGIIYSNTAMPGVIVTGPFYVGNLAAVSLNLVTTLATLLTAYFTNSPTSSGTAVWGISQYNLAANNVCYDEIKVAAPYLWLLSSNNPINVQVAQSTGGRGAPAVNGNNTLLEQYPVSLAAGANMTFITSMIIPGPAICCGYAAGGGIPVVGVRDFPSGAIAGFLGGGQGLTAAGNQSVTTFEFVAGNNPLQVILLNHGAGLDASMGVSIVSKRGY